MRHLLFAMAACTLMLVSRGFCQTGADTTESKYGTLRLVAIMNGQRLVGSWETGAKFLSRGNNGTLTPSDTAGLRKEFRASVITLKRGTVNDLAVYLVENGKQRDITLDPQLTIWSDADSVQFAKGKITVKPERDTDPEWLNADVFSLYVCYSTDQTRKVFGCDQFFLRTK